MHRTVVILCDGEFPKTEYPRHLMRTANFIICCDGALKKFLRQRRSIFEYDRLPDLIIGDMDSLSDSMISLYKDLICKVDEQENNDQTKAFHWAIKNVPAISNIYILGATGERDDHTIGNLSLLMEYARTYDLEAMGVEVEIVTDNGTAFAVTDSIELDCGIGRRVSIFSPDNSLKIHSEGLEWPLDNVVFDNWWKATLNRANADRVKLVFSHRSIALIMLD